MCGRSLEKTPVWGEIRLFAALFLISERHRTTTGPGDWDWHFKTSEKAKNIQRCQLEPWYHWLASINKYSHSLLDVTEISSYGAECCYPCVSFLVADGTMAERSVCEDKSCRVLSSRGSGGKHQVDGPFCHVLRVWHWLSNNGRLPAGVCEVSVVAQTRQGIESHNETLSSSPFSPVLPITEKVFFIV